MKKIFALVLALALVVGLSAQAFAHGYKEFGEAGKRIGKSPVQFVEKFKEEWEGSGFKPFAVIGGSLKGLFYVGKEIVGGFGDAGKVIISHPHDNFYTRYRARKYGEAIPVSDLGRNKK